MESLRDIWRDIRSGRNLDIYITVILSIVVAILGVMEIVDQAAISAAVLAALASVSAIILQSRRDNDSIHTALSKITERKSSETFLIDELGHYERQKEALVGADRAFFWGLTFERLIPHMRRNLGKKIQGGLEAQFLILKPGSKAVKMGAIRDEDQFKAIERIDDSLQRSLLDLSSIAEATPGKGKLKVRWVEDYLPPWTVVAFFDASLEKGQMFVSLLPFREANSDRPSFSLSLDNHQDRRWFRSFKKQFEALWEIATPVDLADYRAQSIAQ